MIPFLLLVTAGCLVVLLRDPSFDRRQLWNAHALRAHARRVVSAFVLGAIGIAMFTAFLSPDQLFALVRRSPALWLAIMVLYPLFSVYPQELIYRTFLFHRYRDVFNRAWMRIAASALAFGYMHIVFRNPIAVALTLIGGAVFALTYERSRSTLLVSLEHALYGCFIFTIGLGVYFYGGAAR